MPPLWTVILAFVLLTLMTFTTPVTSQQSMDNEYEEPEIATGDVDEGYQNVGQNYQYQDEAAFIKDAKSWRKVIQQQANYEAKVKPDQSAGSKGQSIVVISDSEDEIDPLVPSTTPTTTTTTEEPYQDAITRLSCDNPWFWNAIKCFYLDVRERNYVERTTANGKTTAWILGPPILICLVVLLSFCAVTCYFKSRVKAFERRMEDIRTKYEPGSIELDDGTVRKYTPNQEEIDAFENMIATLISIV